LTKSQIVEQSVEAWQIARIAELEGVNAQLRVELDTARSKLEEAERREQVPTSENKGLKRDFENARTTHDAAVKDKAKVLKNEREKLQRFQDSIRKKLAELQRDTESSMATLGGRSAEFPTDTSLSDFFEWFRAEVTTMPTAFVECNENITCYALVGIFQMLAGEGCEHLP
jgi:chromosome segregation ATPase